MTCLKKLIVNASITSITICIIITMVNWVQVQNLNLSSFVFSKAMLTGFLIGFFLYISSSLTFLLIRKIIPEDPYYIRRMILFIPCSILTTIIVVYSINFFFYSFSSQLSYSPFLKKQSLGYYTNFIIISIICSVLIYGFNFYKYYKESQLKMHAQIANEATAKFESLKNQIDPHFLFNSLNVLTGLIEEDPTKAIDYTNSLSRIYRYILEQKNNTTVSVSQEVSFARNYINLLKLRFEDAITCQIDDEISQTNGRTVPLALQLLLENCIQHNVATENAPLHIYIRTDRKNLIISNNLQEKRNNSSSTKIGLNNIIERYKLISTQQIKIVKDNHNFIVKLPILPNHDQT